MQASQFPAALRERLGSHGTAALAEVLAVERTDLVTTVMDTFDRRLIHECASLRSELRIAIDELRVQLRTDFQVEHANIRADLLKWSFLFWVGQVVVVVSLASALN